MTLNYNPTKRNCGSCLKRIQTESNCGSCLKRIQTLEIGHERIHTGLRFSSTLVVSIKAFPAASLHFIKLHKEMESTVNKNIINCSTKNQHD